MALQLASSKLMSAKASLMLILFSQAIGFG
jgi:hypothetical protein